MKYLYLERSEENPLERRIAELATREAARVLSIPKPAVRFFRRHPGDEPVFGAEHFVWNEDWVAGYSQPGLVAVRHGLSELELAVTAIHETRHCWQYAQPIWRQRGREAMERDAFQFEESWPR